MQDSSTFFLTINCQQRGGNQLALPTTAAVLTDAIAFYHQQARWHVELALIMPDHVHLLVTFRWDAQQGMMRMVTAWKRYTARMAGIQWQRDFFDHRIRSEQDHLATWDYMKENPVNAKLVESFELWPYVWRGGCGQGW